MSLPVCREIRFFFSAPFVSVNRGHSRALITQMLNDVEDGPRVVLLRRLVVRQPLFGVGVVHAGLEGLGHALER